VRYLKPSNELLHGLDEGGLNYLYGSIIETFWEESESNQGKWYSALVTDYSTERKEHKLTYDYGTPDETFEWVVLNEEVKKGNVRIPDNESGAFQMAQARRFGEPPFDDETFERMLKSGSRDELQWMLSQTQRKIHRLCSKMPLIEAPSSQSTNFVNLFAKK